MATADKRSVNSTPRRRAPRRSLATPEKPRLLSARTDETRDACTQDPWSGGSAPLKRCIQSEDAEKPQYKRQCVDPIKVDDAVIKDALAVHTYLRQVFQARASRKGGHWNDGCEAVGETVEQIYHEILPVFNNLLPLVSGCQVTEMETESQMRYLTFEFSGQAVQSKGKRKLNLTEELELLRSSGVNERAKEALLTLLACCGSRRQMCWIDSFSDEKPVRGHFARALADPHSTCRMACTDIGNQLLPASFLLYETLPIREVLAEFDDDGPLKEIKRIRSGYQFALQHLVNNDALGTEDARICDERQSIRDLVPDPRLGELIHKNARVINVESYVALAPKHVAQAEGLSKIISAEFENILRKAKADGVAVVLQVGGDIPHLLAKKVYMRANNARHGLRCGYIRWRSSYRAPWGQEQRADNRCCIGLQLP